MLRLYEESRHILTPDRLREYIYGGHGMLTLQSPSGKHHCYLFSRPRNADVFPEDVLFVYAVHDKQKLFYVGMIEDDQFRLTLHSRFDRHTEIVRGAFFLTNLMRNPDIHTSMVIYHEGMCAACGRRLRTPQSLIRGIGPKCAARLAVKGDSHGRQDTRVD